MSASPYLTDLAGWLTHDRAVRLLELRGWRVFEVAAGGYFAIYEVSSEQIQGSSPVEIAKTITGRNGAR
jgi:hypothetical protein